MCNLESILSFTVLVRYVLLRFFTDFYREFFCRNRRRSRHSATDEGKDEERWTGLVSLLPLEADDDNRDDDDEFQIRKEGEGNADKKEFFISR